MSEERQEITWALGVAILAALMALGLVGFGCLLEIRAFQIRGLEILILGATFIAGGIFMAVISVVIWIKARG